jgi:hypothetical protein
VEDRINMLKTVNVIEMKNMMEWRNVMIFGNEIKMMVYLVDLTGHVMKSVSLSLRRGVNPSSDHFPRRCVLHMFVALSNPQHQ